MHRYALVVGPLLLVVAQSSACDPPLGLPSQSADASRWFDVVLPDVSVPDGFILTDLATDGSTAVSSPSASCNGMRQLDAGAQDGGASSGVSDAAFVFDAPPDGAACATPLAHGDLVFDEVMISSETGSDDRGQWLEVRSTRACSVDLVGLAASAPHGASFHTLSVTTDLWIPAGGFFLIADTLDPSENNSLPGLVLAWDSSPADAIHKTSDTITLSVGTVTLDTLSYPSKKRVVGTSLAFPSDCSPVLRADFANWVPSTASWTTGFYGTPAAPNTDVTCTTPTIPMCRAARGDPR